MAALTSLDEVTDTLVLDYLTRRCHPSLAEAFKKDRGICDKTPVDCPNNLTLEKVALPYVKSSPAPLNFHSVPFLGGGVLDRKPLPPLPELVIQEILSYLPTDDLFSTRFLSSAWNSMCSESLRKRYRAPIRLQSVDQICKLAKTIRSRPHSDWLNPFPAYHFFPEQGGTLDLLNLIGPEVKIAIFHLTSKCPDKIFSLLDLTPFIEEVNFHGHCDMVHVKGPVLRHLRKLSLSRSPSPDTNKRSHSYNRSELHYLKLSVLQNWLKLAPALQELRCNYTIRPSTNEDFCQFAQLCHSLRHVSFTSIACPRDVDGQAGAILPNADLRLEIQSVPYKRGRGTTKLVEALSGSLNRLTLTLETRDVKFGVLPQLTYLRMAGVADSLPETLPAISFPSLRSVTFEFRKSHTDMWHPFDGDVFLTVATLRLIFHADADAKVSFHDWGDVFPELTSLGVASTFDASILDSIVDNFDHVTHLHLCDTRTRRQRHGSLAKAICDTERPRDRECTFSTFEDLEHLELECSWALRRLMVEVMSISTEELMYPLQNLTIIHNSQIEQDESDLFLLLRGLKYHEDVKLIFQEEPSYKAW